MKTNRSLWLGAVFTFVIAGSLNCVGAPDLSDPNVADESSSSDIKTRGKGHARSFDGGSDGGEIVIAVAGDISSAAIGNQKKTADLIVGAGYDAVLTLGDTQYPDGNLSDFNNYFDKTWGRFKNLIHPALGNHEYGQTDASGYFDYFGALAGDRKLGYYSFNLGSWHLIALNSSDGCSPVSCDATSPQGKWLQADLAANTQKCTLAYWHHPRFNSGNHHGNLQQVQPFWDMLYAAHADVVLNGHEHVYERFDPQDPKEKADPAHGIRAFTVGTGGAQAYSFGTPLPNSAKRSNTALGVLKMTLKASSYDWEFVPAAGSTFTDSGSGVCH